MPFWKPKSVINKIVKVLIWSDFLMLSAGGFLTPIFAVFVTGQIAGAGLATVGFAATLYWTAKSLVQFPVAWYADKTKGERDDYAFVLIGSVIMSAVPLLYYLFASKVGHVYLFETLNGIGAGFTLPTWMAIFGRHLDKGKESTEWTLHSNAIGFGYAAAAAAGGLLAQRFGFRVIFLLVSALMFAGTAVLIFIKEEILKSDIRNGFPPKSGDMIREQASR